MANPQPDKRHDPKTAFYSLLVSVPYVLFLLVLMVDPGILGWVPIKDSVISLAIYVAAILYIWPIVISFIFLKRVERS